MIIQKRKHTRIKKVLNATGGMERNLMLVTTYWLLFIPIYQSEIFTGK